MATRGRAALAAARPVAAIRRRRRRNMVRTPLGEGRTLGAAHECAVSV
jgi:hypothetical protein